MEYFFPHHCDGVWVLRRLARQLDSVGEIRFPRGEKYRGSALEKGLSHFHRHRVDWLGLDGAGYGAVGGDFSRNYFVWRDGVFVTLGRMDCQSDYDLYRVGF